VNKITFVNFRKKIVVEEGFSVDMKNDYNVIYEKFLQSDRELLEKKLYEQPPGADCPSDEEIDWMSSSAADKFTPSGEKLMAKILAHADNCPRCEALLRYNILQKKYGVTPLERKE
jgi:hypothetical protein